MILLEWMMMMVSEKTFVVIAFDEFIRQILDNLHKNGRMFVFLYRRV
jgi:hypothetical protein